MTTTKRVYKKLRADLKAALQDVSSGKALFDIRTAADARSVETRDREISTLRTQIALLHEIRTRDLALTINIGRSPLPR
jgi:hypothetical protein